MKPLHTTKSVAGALETPIRIMALSSDRKLAPVALVKNTTKRLRPEPQGPFVSSTYVSIRATCPDSCRFKGDGCYASEGFTGRALRKMDRSAKNLSGDAVISIECSWIDETFKRGVPQDGARGGRDLRLHVGGDVSSQRAAGWLADSATAWQLRGGGTVWTYTHRWREIDRGAWGCISVLASVETAAEAKEAMAEGYVPAITMAEFPSDRAFDFGGVKVVPCPQQTRGVTCIECRLCLDRDLRKMGVAIGFAVHGQRAPKIRRRLVVLVGKEEANASRKSLVSVF